jgi:hypothetical protein
VSCLCFIALNAESPLQKYDEITVFASWLGTQCPHAVKRELILQRECDYALDQSGLQLWDAVKRKPALFKVTALQTCPLHPETEINLYLN